MCTIWDDVRTYLISTIDPKDKSVFDYFKIQDYDEPRISILVSRR